MNNQKNTLHIVLLVMVLTLYVVIALNLWRYATYGV